MAPCNKKEREGAGAGHRWVLAWSVGGVGIGRPRVSSSPQIPREYGNWPVTLAGPRDTSCRTHCLTAPQPHDFHTHVASQPGASAPPPPPMPLKPLVGVHAMFNRRQDMCQHTLWSCAWKASSPASTAPPPSPLPQCTTAAPTSLSLSKHCYMKDATLTFHTNVNA